MSTQTIPHPPVAPYSEWLEQRKKLLAHEKELTRLKDSVNAERRRLPMVKIDKDYTFDGPTGKAKLGDLFQGQRQLIIYHFMFDPEWDKGCDGCTGFVDALGDLSMLGRRDTAFALVSRAPLAKLEKYKAERGWTRPWYSSFESDFNYDFHVTHDEKVAPIEYNYMNFAQLEERRGKGEVKGEDHGISVFFRVDNDIFHTYSAFARGTEDLTDSYNLLDITP